MVVLGEPLVLLGGFVVKVLPRAVVSPSQLCSLSADGGRAFPLVPLLADSSPVADLGDLCDIIQLLPGGDTAVTSGSGGTSASSTSLLASVSLSEAWPRASRALPVHKGIPLITGYVLFTGSLESADYSLCIVCDAAGWAGGLAGFASC